jgi:AraC-like DNA-binding protein
VNEVNGRQYMLSPGDIVWFHEDERVKVEVIRGPWSFYTTNFAAPTLSPPPFEWRAFRGEGRVQQAFEDLLSAWRTADGYSAVRAMRVQSRLLELLALFAERRAALPFDVDPATQLWWRLETELRCNLAQPVTLGRMVDLTGKSRATIARACRRAVGLPPLQRMKQVKMSLARSLIAQSHLQIGEIAVRIGYPRVHEFSRDYRRHFGVTPSADRHVMGR